MGDTDLRRIGPTAKSTTLRSLEISLESWPDAKLPQKHKLLHSTGARGTRSLLHLDSFTSTTRLDALFGRVSTLSVGSCGFKPLMVHSIP